MLSYDASIQNEDLFGQKFEFRHKHIGFHNRVQHSTSSPKIENPKVVKRNFCETPYKFRILFRKVNGTVTQNLKRMLVRYLEQTQLEKHCNSREKELVRLNPVTAAKGKSKGKGKGTVGYRTQ